jgi:uncharacterized membrane protein
LPPESDSSPTSQAPARPVSLLQLGLVAAFIIGYALLSHYSTTTDAKGLGAALTIAPILLIGAVMLWQWTHPLLALAVFAAVGVLLVYFWPLLTKYYEWADVGQQCGAYALVSVGFARSLVKGRVPLCTQLSDKLHGPLTPVEIAYTRKATVAWTIFYGLLAIAILALFFLTPLRVWSLFVNFATFGLIGVLFLIDHAIRRRVLPRRPGGVLAAIRQSLTGSN